jgi:signal peptidase I
MAVKAASHRASRHSSDSVGHVSRRVQQVLTTVVGLAVLGAVAIACVALIRGTWILTPILSGSMRPGLPVGGLAISERVPVDRLVVRDVIVFREPNNPTKQVVHRIVRLRTNKSGQILINTQGDANTVRDPWTLTIRGRYAYQVRWTIPLLGYVGVAYQNDRGFVLLGVGLALVALAVTMATGLVRGRKRRAREERRSTLPEISPDFVLGSKVGSVSEVSAADAGVRILSDGNGTAARSAPLSPGNGSARPAVVNGSTGNVGVEPMSLDRVRASDAVSKNGSSRRRRHSRLHSVGARR